VLPTDRGGYLIDEICFSYVSCGRDLLRARVPARHDAARPLLVADPTFDLEGPPSLIPTASDQSRHFNQRQFHFDPLPGSRLEADLIAPLLGFHDAWTGCEALEGRLKRECRSPKILHIATHGFFLEDQSLTRGFKTETPLEEFELPENPLLRSGLAFAGANTWLAHRAAPPDAEDGLLTAVDVVGLDLASTQLVVLSACDTGLGEAQVGEGVFGLRRSFVLAGARTLVMSLWKVSDVATALLMERFYTHLLVPEPGRATGLERHEALRRAQLFTRCITMRELRELDHPAIAAFAAEPEPDHYTPFADPFFWGAFICQGDTAPIAPPSVNA
jgi:CHAT domain-containing protein